MEQPPKSKNIVKNRNMELVPLNGNRSEEDQKEKPDF